MMPRKLTKEETIKSFKDTHRDKYDYSLVEYKNNYTPVKIICKKCDNTFEQQPQIHKTGSGCTKCIKVSPRKFSQEYVISLFKEVHNDRYDYSEFIFEGMNRRSTLKML